MSYTNHQILEAYHARFTEEPILVHAPGRINLIGEHTDYNEGFVMPAAIDKEIIFAMALSGDGRSSITSLDMNATVELDVASPMPLSGEDRWANYLLGTLRRIQDLGHALNPFHCVLGSNIPVGAGMSSSAAIECGFILGVDRLHGLHIPKKEMALIAQWSDHNYVGVKSGIMDQFASLMGKQGHAMVLDCRSLEHRYCPLDMTQHTFVLFDSSVKHALASSEYNTRRQECEQGVQVLSNRFQGITSLRDASLPQLEEVGEEMDATVFGRCRYVIEENARLLKAARHLEADDLWSFGQCMYETHEGLSKLYAVSCSELDFLVEAVRKFPAVLGARLMGGGFGGCTINLVERGEVKAITDKVSTAYQAHFGKDLPAYTVQVVDGCHIIEG